MNPSVELPEVTVAAARWAALRQQVAQVQTWLAAEAARAADEALAYRLRVLAAVTARLGRFAEQHLQFFLDPAYAAPAGYTPAYAVTLALRQVGWDLEAIQQAASQRLKAAPGSAEQATLDIADKLARRALARAQAAGLGVGATALTYFQKSPFIAGLPYAPAALIGFSFSATAVKRDLLALPHEVGHYVFWNTPAGAAFARSLPAWLDDHPVGRWAEEVFADTFAALVAGPAGALSLQELLVWHPEATFSTSDPEDDHPTPILRPYVAAQVLRQRGLGEAAERLERRWARVSAAKTLAPVCRLPGGVSRPVTEIVTVGAAMTGEKPLDRLIQAADTALAGVGLDGEWAGQTARWGEREVDDAVAAAELDDLFPRRVAAVNEPAPAELPAAPGDPWGEWLRAQGLAGRPGENWLAIAHARGWTHGPGDNWPRTG